MNKDILMSGCAIEAIAGGANAEALKRIARTIAEEGGGFKAPKRMAEENIGIYFIFSMIMGICKKK